MHTLKPGTAFGKLVFHYENRLSEARKAHAAGRRVVGRIGHTVPAELIVAAGCTPVLIAADLERATPVADIYVDPELPPETRTLFEAGVAGDFEFLDYLILSRPYDKLYYFLKELYRLGRAPKMPPFMIFDLMQSQREAVRAYNWGRLQVLVERLGRLASAPLEADAIRFAINLSNRARAMQRQVADLRQNGRISGVDAMQALGAGYFMHPAEYAETLGAYIADVKASSARRPSGPRILLATAEPLQQLMLHQTLEADGATVVAEDDNWGARAPGEDISDESDPLVAIFDKYWRDVPTSGVYPQAAREHWLLEQAARAEVDVVVFYVPPSDRLMGWDIPRLTETMRQKGKPVLTLFHDAMTEKGRNNIRQELAALASSLSHNTPSTQEARR